MKKTISIALIIIWMAVIFWFSSMPGDESNTKSKSTIKEVIETIIPRKKAEKTEETKNNEVNEISQNTQSQNQTETTTNPETKDANTMQTQQNQAKQKELKEEQLIEKLNKPLRKCMHASVYFVLGILIFNCLKTFKISGGKTVIIPIGIAFLYACTDEFHQLFVDGRTSQFTDVLIDTFGAILGVALINIIFCCANKFRVKKE